MIIRNFRRKNSHISSFTLILSTYKKYILYKIIDTPYHITSVSITFYIILIIVLISISVDEPLKTMFRIRAESQECPIKGNHNFWIFSLCVGWLWLEMNVYMYSRYQLLKRMQVLRFSWNDLIKQLNLFNTIHNNLYEIVNLSPSFFEIYN